MYVPQLYTVYTAILWYCEYLVIITGNHEILIIIMSTNTDVCFPYQPLFEMQ